MSLIILQVIPSLIGYIIIILYFNCATWSLFLEHNFSTMSEAYVDLPHLIIQPWTTSLNLSLCRIRGSNSLLLHHSFDLMSSLIDYICMKSLDNCVVIIINLMSSSRNSIEFMMGNTILAPRWFMFSSTTLLPSIQHNLFAFCVNLEITATQQLIFLTSEVLPSLFVKNVARISPPLYNSWYHNTSCHLRSFLGPRIDFNWNTDSGAMTCEFKTSSNPIALKWMGDSSF